MPNAEQTVVMSTLAAGGIVILAEIAEDGVTSALVRPAVGTFLAVAALLLIANFWPQGAMFFAVILLVTAFVVNGRPFLKVINNLIGD